MHYSFSQGLPSGFVHQICIQEKGPLLIATQKGLVQFDGYRFLRLPFSRSNTPSLFVKGNNLYFHDFKTGLVKYNLQLHTLSPLSFLNYEDTVSYNDHYDNLFVDSGERIWCTDFEAVKYLAPGQKNWKRFLLHPGNKGSFQAFFWEYAAGKIVIVSTQGLYEWDLHSQQLIKVSTQNFSCYTATSGTELLVASGQDLYRYKAGQQRLENLGKLPGIKRINGLTAITNNTIIVNDPSSLYRLELPHMVLSSLFRLEGKTIQSTTYDSVCKVFWIATDKGLSKLSNINNNTGVQQLKITIPEKITSIVPGPKEEIWVAGDHFLGFFDAQSKYHALPVPDVRIYAFATAARQLFLCTSAGLYLLKDRRLVTTSLKSGLKKMVIDTSGHYWIIDLQNKVQVLNQQGIVLPQFLKNQAAIFWKENIWNDIFIDRQQKIWLAGYMPKSFGITSYHPDQQQFVEIMEGNPKSDFIGDYYNRIGIYDQNHLLFSGYGGFNIVSLKGKITRKIDAINHPIENEHVEGICADAKGNVWFGTAEGLHFWNAREDQISVLTETDGLPSNDLVYGFSKINEHKLAVGSSGILSLLQTEQMLSSRLRNRLELTAIKIDDSIQLNPPDTIVLSPSHRNISFLFSTLNFEQKEKSFYKYQINKGPWIHLNNNPEIDFNQIEPGRYTIHIQAQDNLGMVQPKTLTLYLVIKAPFYKTLWFNLAVLFGSITLVSFITAAFFARKRKIDLLSSKIKEVEMQTLRSQMNPHFLFNSLNSIKGFILENKTDMASDYLTKFSKLMRNILENSRMSTISLEKELQTVEWYIQLEAARLEHGFDYILQCSKELDAENIALPPLVLQPFVENAIWHGLRSRQDGLLEITAEPADKNFISLKIRDNGIGRKASKQKNSSRAKEHQSMGIAITRERLLAQHPKNQLIITDLTDKNQVACGTLVELIIFSAYD